MKVSIFLLAAFLGLAAALPVDKLLVSEDVAARNSFFEQLFLDMLEDLRETMVTGSEDIPVLDPFELEHLHLELDDLGLEGAHVTLENLEARKLSTFIIDDLSITSTSVILQRYAIELEGHIPVIEVDSEVYDIHMNVMGGTIFGTGNAKLRIIEPRIQATMEAGLSIIGGISVNLRSARIVFTLGAFQPEVTGMFGNPIVDEFVNLFLSYLVEDLVENFQDEISDFLSDLVMEVGNDVLDSILPALLSHNEEISKKLQLLTVSEAQVTSLKIDSA